MTATRKDHYDVIVIGSGFGGCMAALESVERGKRVLMLERGGWVERNERNWGDEGAFVLTPHYDATGGYNVRSAAGGWKEQGITTCVGGPSVFYGGASFRFREEDFHHSPEIVEGTDAEWPIGYSDLERHYGRAEELLGVAGEHGVDPTEPPRSRPYPKPPLPYATTGERMAEAADSLGMRPFRIPMAIDEATCQACITCDAFACAVEAKNDLATRVIPGLLASGLELRPCSVVTGLVASGDRIAAVKVRDSSTGEQLHFSADQVVLAAGALASPQIVLASGLESRNPGGEAVGRFLMRHCNAMIYGYFSGTDRPSDRHHKQIAIQDFYFGDPDRPGLGKLGNVQQVMTPPTSLVRAMLPQTLGLAASALISNLTGLLVIAEDQPRPENRVEIRAHRRDEHGLPEVRIHHRYTRRDIAARRALARRARQVLKKSGAWFTVTWKVGTFSHAVGTLRMGRDPRTSVVDAEGRFRGVDNLFVADGSIFPTSGGLNPSLTIAANALRIGEVVAAA